MKRGLILFLVASLLVVCLTLVGYAAGAQDFSDVVASIDESRSYGERSDTVYLAQALYDELSEEDRATVSSEYEALLREAEALREIAGRADAFILGVGILKETYDLDESEAQLRELMSEETYFDDESYPGVSDALSALDEMKENILTRVDACVAFMNAIDKASLLPEDDYVGIKALLLEADGYRSVLDATYDGVTGALDGYNYLSGLFFDKEIYTKDFLVYVGLMNEATTYKDVKEYYNQAMSQTRNEDFLADYKGVREAMESLKLKEKYFEDCIFAANGFITAVGNIGDYENAADGIIAAYAALRGVDTTVEGVSVAMKTLSTATDSYNESVRAANEALEIL